MTSICLEMSSDFLPDLLFLSQYHSNAQYTAAKRMHVLRMHTLSTHGARQQMNQIIRTTVQCVQHSIKPQPSVCHPTDQQLCRWSVGHDYPSRLETGMRYTLCCRAPPYSVVNGVQVRAVDDDDDDDDDGRINFNVAYSPKTARTQNS